MEHIACPQCGASNLKTDPQCLSCGATLFTRQSTPPPVVELTPAEPYWETPQGQRRIALISGAVLLIGLGILLQGLFGIMLIPILCCAGIWELIQWSRERQQAKDFERAHDKESLQAELARYDRPDKYVQTKTGILHVKGFDSRLDSSEKKK